MKKIEAMPERVPVLDQPSHAPSARPAAVTIKAQVKYCSVDFCAEGVVMGISLAEAEMADGRGAARVCVGSILRVGQVLATVAPQCRHRESVAGLSPEGPGHQGFASLRDAGRLGLFIRFRI